MTLQRKATAFLVFAVTWGTFALICAAVVTFSASEHDNEVARASGVPHASRGLLSTKESSADNIKKTKKRMPRYGLDGKPAPSDFEPDDQRYFEGILMYAAVGVLFALLSVLFGIVFCCCRCCCGCCGGRKPTEGCCCPDKESVRIYTTCERWWVRIAMFIIVGSVFAMAIMGYVGNGDFTDGIDTFIGTFVSVLERTRVRVVALGLSFQTIETSTGITGGPSEAIGRLADAMTDAIDASKDFKSTVKDYNELREIFLNSIYGWTMFIALFGLLGALCNCTWPACILAVFGFFTLFIVWLMFAIHFPVSILLADVCRSVETYIDDRRACNALNGANVAAGRPTVDCTDEEYTPTGKYLNDIIQCKGKDEQGEIIEKQWTMMTTMLFASDSSGDFDSSVTSTNPFTVSIRGLMKHCGHTVDSFKKVGRWRWVGEWTNATKTYYGEVMNYPENPDYVNIKDNRVSLEEDLVDRNASGQCLPLGGVDIPDKFGKLLDGYIALDGLTMEILDLTSCDYMLDAFEEVNTKLCTDALQALDLIAGSFTTMGFLFWFACFFAILGMKRFTKQDEAAVSDGPAGPQYEMQAYASAPQDETGVYADQPPAYGEPYGPPPNGPAPDPV